MFAAHDNCKFKFQYNGVCLCLKRCYFPKQEKMKATRSTGQLAVRVDT